jgi:hypothetical protein
LRTRDQDVALGAQDSAATLAPEHVQRAALDLVPRAAAITVQQRVVVSAREVVVGVALGALGVLVVMVRVIRL